MKMLEPETQFKKIKLEHKNYENSSKEELIACINQLEATIAKLKESNSTSVSDPFTCETGRNFDFSKYKYRRVAFKILYLGWSYNGFEGNGNNTIEYHLFKAFLKSRLIKDRKSCNYSKCGRTDQGVSSFSQVISLDARTSSTEITKELPYCKILNSLLPKDIRIIAWSYVPEDFNARFSCKKRTYKYWFPRGNLNIEAMNNAAQYLVGTHDFRNLCKRDIAHGVVKFKRDIFEASISLYTRISNSESADFDMFVLTIIGSGFLWHQIRAIVSILFLIGQNKENPEIMKELLNISRYPRKPQYEIANPTPLNLFDCEFEDIHWEIDQKSLTDIVISLQSYWTDAAIKTSMIENMLLCCNQLLDTNLSVTQPYSSLCRDSSKNYKPILSRPTGDTLENRISYFIKKGKLMIMNPEDSSYTTCGN